MTINIKELATNTLKGLAVIATVALSAYAEGMGKRVVPTKTLPFASSPDDMAIAELLKSAKDYWSDSDKVSTAEKIASIAGKENQTSYTKTVAISALSQIRDELWSSSSKKTITDLIVGITQ